MLSKYVESNNNHDDNNNKVIRDRVIWGLEASRWDDRGSVVKAESPRSSGKLASRYSPDWSPADNRHDTAVLNNPVSAK